jgi:hypothetical protein
VINGVEEIARKRLELLHELLPKAGSLALLVNATAAELAELQTREVRSAAQTLGVHLHVLNASTEQDFDRVFACRHLRAKRENGNVGRKKNTAIRLLCQACDGAFDDVSGRQRDDPFAMNNVEAARSRRAQVVKSSHGLPPRI